MEIGVDSGQAGFFTATSYKNDSIIKENELSHICPDEPWFSACCKATSSPFGAGVVKHGAVSESGNGDGCYKCYTIINDGLVVAAFLNFGILNK